MKRKPMHKWLCKGTLVAAVVALLAPSPVAAEGVLGDPVATPVGTFGGIAYLQYDGLFEGETSTGAYRVPYRISAPADPESREPRPSL